QRERDALRLAAAEHQGLQARWTKDVQALEGVRAELAAASALRWRTRKRHRSRCNARRQMISRLAKARESSASVPSSSQPGFR
ncbi:transposase, partial [Xanthomonas campestris pv. campestris]|nr:transposase [Xanthomonas campestris pv. campestris]